MAVSLAASAILPSLTPHTPAAEVVAFLHALNTQKTTTTLNSVFAWEVVAKNRKGLDLEFGSPGQADYHPEKPLFRHCGQAAQAARASGSLFLVEGRGTVAQTNAPWHAYGVLYKDRQMFVYDPDYTAPPQRLGNYAAIYNLRTALVNRAGGARAVDQVWISGEGNVNELNHRLIVQLWMERVAGVGVSSILPGFVGNPAAAGWAIVPL
ncbi:MAG: hypothetical protein M1830_010608 [Pleopsidium flavum]|nr:MAG: hypothetical protein M1830_010608 [Pleopsidium flavum]